MTKLNWYDNILQGIAMKMVVAVHGLDQGRSEWVSESIKYIKEVLRPAKAQTNKQTNKQTIKGQSVTQAEAPPRDSPLSSSNWEEGSDLVISSAGITLLLSCHCIPYQTKPYHT